MKFVFWYMIIRYKIRKYIIYNTLKKPTINKGSPSIHTMSLLTQGIINNVEIIHIITPITPPFSH